MLITQDDGPDIACLFVRSEYGPPSPAEVNNNYVRSVVGATGSAMTSLLRGLAQVTGHIQHKIHCEMRMPRINSGLFRIPWDDTAAVLESLVMPAELAHMNPARFYGPADALSSSEQDQLATLHTIPTRTGLPSPLPVNNQAPLTLGTPSNGLPPRPDSIQPPSPPPESQNLPHIPDPQLSGDGHGALHVEDYKDC